MHKYICKIHYMNFKYFILGLIATVYSRFVLEEKDVQYNSKKIKIYVYGNYKDRIPQLENVELSMEKIIINPENLQFNRFYINTKKALMNIEQNTVANKILNSIEFKNTLKKIFVCNNLKPMELLCFLAHSFFNTSYFKNMENKDSTDKYRSSGLLQICGKKNYEILDEIRKKNQNPLSKYKSLDASSYADLNDENISITMEFYKEYILKNAYSDMKNDATLFELTLKFLNPTDYQHLSKRENIKGIDLARIENRLRIYNALVIAFKNSELVDIHFNK